VKANWELDQLPLGEPEIVLSDRKFGLYQGTQRNKEFCLYDPSVCNPIFLLCALEEEPLGIKMKTTLCSFIRDNRVMYFLFFFREKLISHSAHFKKMDQAVTFLVFVRKVLDSNPDLTPNNLCAFADCLLASSQQNLYDIYLLLCVQYLTPDDGQTSVRNM